jgi:hypothetical protein
LQGDVLTMTDVEGVAVRRRSGEIVKQTLQTGDDPHVIAQRLTLSIYRMSRGDGIDFNRPLNYPNIGVV